MYAFRVFAQAETRERKRTDISIDGSQTRCVALRVLQMNMNISLLGPYSGRTRTNLDNGKVHKNIYKIKIYGLILERDWGHLANHFDKEEGKF